MHLCKNTNNKLVHGFQIQKFTIIYLNIYIYLLQVENLNLATNLKNYYFYVMLIACKCTPLYMMHKIIFKNLNFFKSHGLLNSKLMDYISNCHFFVNYDMVH